MVLRKISFSGCLIGGMISLTAFGATTFPHVGDNYDVADPAAWGGEDKMPTTTEAVYFDVSGATYTMSADMTFGYPYPKAPNMLFDFSATPERKVTLTSTSLVMYPWTTSCSFIFRGGTWIANGGTANVVSSSSTGASNYWRLEGGVLVTNVGSVALKAAGNVNTTTALVIKEASRLYVKSGLSNRYAGPNAYRLDGDPTAAGVCIDISGGSLARFADSPYLGGGATLVRGANTKLIARGTLVASSNGDSDGILHVTDGATVEAVTLIVGGSSLSSNGLVCVDNCATGLFSNVYQGAQNSSVGRGQRFVLGSGAFAETTGSHYLHGTNSVLVISNGTYRVGSWLIGQSNSDRDHELVLTGPQASLALTGSHYSLFNRGRGHLIAVRGGAAFTWTGNPYFGNYASVSNTLEISGESSSFTSTGGFYLNGYQASAQGGIGNVVRVADGATLTCTNTFNVTGSDNRIVVSNGTLRVLATGENTFFMLGELNNVSATTNNMLVFEGTTPRFETGRSAYFRNGSRIVWRLPVEGYPAGHVTLQAEGVSLYNETEFDFEGLDELQANLEAKHAEYTLVSTEGRNGFVPEATAPTIVRANEKLAERGCRLYVSDSQKSVILSVRSTKQHGLMLIFR